MELPSLLRPCFFWKSHTYQHCDFLLGILQLVNLHCSIWPIWLTSANAALAPHPRLQTSYPFYAHFTSFPSAPLPPPHASGCFSLSPSISTKELLLPRHARCVLPRHARCVLSRLRCNGHNLLEAPISLELAESKILLAALAGTVPGHLSSYSALSSYGLFASLALWQFSVSLRPLIQALGSCPVSGASQSSAINPFFGKGRVTAATTAKLNFQTHYYVTK